MFTAWLSTLDNLAEKLVETHDPSFAEDLERLEGIIEEYENNDLKIRETLSHLQKLSPNDEAGEYDPQIQLTPQLKVWLESLIIKLTYPACRHHSQESAQYSAHCQCRLYHQEFNILLNKLNQTEISLEELIANPFRQSRNAYGFTGITFSGMNIILSFTPVVGLGLTCGLLAAPSLLAGYYIYRRGKNEAQLLYADHQADFFERKVNLLCKHKETVHARQQIETKSETYSLASAQSLIKASRLETPSQYLQSEQSLPNPQRRPKQEFKKTRRKHPKEKKTDGGNPIGHFFGVTVATGGISLAFIHFGVLAGVIAAGPIAWGITAAVAVGMGAYFAYKRSKQTSKELKFQNSMASLAAREADLQKIQKAAKRGEHWSFILDKKSKNQLAKVPESLAVPPQPRRRRVIVPLQDQLDRQSMQRERDKHSAKSLAQAGALSGRKRVQASYRPMYPQVAPHETVTLSARV